jgi:NRPS condensation-like uncharacterized protein
MSVNPRGTALVRPIGALERQFFRYAESNPVHFLLVAEFDVVLDAQRLRSALDAVQRRHPLLSVHVEDHPSSRLGFYRAQAVARIPLTVREGGSDWRPLAATELTRPFDRSTAPLIRATLLRTPTSSAIVLTFDHTISDGVSSFLVLNDLVAALNDCPLEIRPVPPALEDLIARSLGSTVGEALREPDERMAEPVSHRPFDGLPPFLHAVAMTEADTTRLVARCRAEHTTVHSSILVAASRARSQQVGDAFVRALSPINVRELISADDDCAAYFTGTCTGLAPADGNSFWEQARAMSADLAGARSAAGVVSIAQAVGQAMTVDATTATAEHVFGKLFAWDVLTTNLGRKELTDTGTVAPSAIWAPIVHMQAAGEYAIGIITYRGQLRMTCVGYTPVADYLHEVRDTLTAVLDA